MPLKKPRKSRMNKPVETPEIPQQPAAPAVSPERQFWMDKLTIVRRKMHGASDVALSTLQAEEAEIVRRLGQMRG